jgi:hypothetical protein
MAALPASLPDPTHIDAWGPAFIETDKRSGAG